MLKIMKILKFKSLKTPTDQLYNATSDELDNSSFLNYIRNCSTKIIQKQLHFYGYVLECQIILKKSFNHQQFSAENQGLSLCRETLSKPRLKHFYLVDNFRTCIFVTKLGSALDTNQYTRHR